MKHTDVEPTRIRCCFVVVATAQPSSSAVGRTPRALASCSSVSSGGERCPRSSIEMYETETPAFVARASWDFSARQKWSTPAQQDWSRLVT